MAQRKRFLAVLPVAVAAVAVGAILSEPLPIPADYVGDVTGDVEKDTYGRDLTGRAAMAEAPRYSQVARALGPVTGDAEKDTFGFVVLRASTGGLASIE